MIRNKVVIAIPCLEIVIEPPLSFTFDGLTEKLTTLTCHTEEEVEAAIKRSIYFVSDQDIRLNIQGNCQHSVHEQSKWRSSLLLLQHSSIKRI